MNAVSRSIGAFLINARPLRTLRRQFTFVLLLLAVLVVAFGATAIFALNQSRTATQELAEQQLMRLQVSHDLVWQILSAAALADKLVKTSSVEEAGSRFADLEAELKKVEMLVDKLSGADNDLNVLNLQYSNQLFSATASAVVQQRGLLQAAHENFDPTYRRSYDRFTETAGRANANTNVNTNDNARMILEMLQTTTNASTVRQLRTTLGNLPGVKLPWSDSDNDPFTLRLLELDRQATIDLLQNALRQHVLNLMASAREQSDHFAADYRNGVLDLAQTTMHRQLWIALLLSISLLLLWLIAHQFIGRHVLGRMRVISRHLRLERQAGESSQAPVPISGSDEIAEMARALERLLEDRGQLQLARRQLEESEAHLATIIEYAADGFVIVQEGVIRQLNPAARALLGWQPGESPRLAVDSLASYSGPSFQVDTVAQTANGGAVPVEVSISEVSLPGGRAVILVIRDATLRRETERQLTWARDAAESARAAHAALLSNMADEFHTPLNAILNHTQILESEPLLGDLVRGRVETIEQNAQHLRKLIGNILDLAEIEAGRMTLDIHQFDLDALLRAVADRTVLKCEPKGVAMQRGWAPDLPAIHGDEKRLRQVLRNLLSNAAAFSRKGHVRLGVEWHSADSEKGVLRFEIEDSSDGIDAGDLERLLAHFTGGAKGAEGMPGTGGKPLQDRSRYALDLTLSARLLALMGSRLQARSTIGKGSVFWFDLPVVYACVGAGD